MLFIQWEEFCVASSLLIHPTVQHVVTEGVCQHKPYVLAIFCVKDWAKIWPFV